jgi:hypothetical protein
MHHRLACALALVPLLLSGCGREPTSSVQPPPVVPRPAGLVEITITGIGTPQQRASARSVTAPATGAVPGAAPARHPSSAPAAIAAARLTTIAEGDGTVELVAASTASFTFGPRTGGGYRYVSATFQVRNATAAGVVYTTARTNLTLLGVNATGSLSGTAIKTLNKFDGTAIATGLETQTRPTGWAQLSGTQTITAAAPDILQVYTEAEVAATPRPSGVASLQPYGFVVRNPNSSSSRTLAANPGASQYDGVLTVAYKVPLQATAADDPFTITGLFLAVDDHELWVTQSVEDSDATSVSALAARAAALDASLRALCTVRIGGTAAEPTGFIAESIGVASVSPNPFGVPDSLIDGTASLAATFTQALTGASAATFVVNSFQGGRAFLGGSYGGAGTATLNTPTGHFWPGDVVEVALTGSLHGASPGAGVCPPFVYRYRVKATGGSAAFAQPAGSPNSIGYGPRSVALGDVNGDGKLDLLTANPEGNTVTVLLGDGAGGWTTEQSFSAVSGPNSVALGDVNGDGKVDLVTANHGNNSVTVGLGGGAGGFTLAGSFGVGYGPRSVALGDVNGDGKLDAVTANTEGNTVTVLLGNGAGGLTAAGAFSVGYYPPSVALGDVNGDGKLDVVTATQSNSVNVLLGNGAGTFAAAGGFSVGHAQLSVALGDVNGDGKLDLVTANDGSSVTVGLGNGAGGFTAAGSFGVGYGPSSVALGDVNGDGKLDAVTANYGDNTVTVLLGNGAGGLTAAGSFSVGSYPYSVALGDLNGDGKLDLVTANLTGNSVTVLLNSTASSVTPYVGQNQPGLVGYPVNIRPAVKVTDAAANPMVGAEVTFGVSGGGSGTGLVAKTNSSGVAQVGSWTLGASPGNYLMTATVTGSGIAGNPVPFYATGFAPGYDIQIQYYGPTPSAAIQAAMSAAVAKWQTVIYRPVGAVQVNMPEPCIGGPPVNQTISNLLILAKFDSIDGPGKILGQATSCVVRSTNYLPVVGHMVFDTADVAAMISQGLLIPAMVHEMSHVVGFAPFFWNHAGCLQLPSDPPYTINDSYFSCAHGRAAFDSVGGMNYTGGGSSPPAGYKVPIENCGTLPWVFPACTAGTVNSHWREAVMTNELMTGWIDPGGSPLSIVTIAAQEDLGYVVNYAAADPYVHTFMAAAVRGAQRLFMGDDIYRGPVYVVDASGHVVGVERPR